MIKLLMIVFITKLYARNNIFKRSVFILNFVHVAQLTLLCLLLTLIRSVIAGYVFNNAIRLIKKDLYCKSRITSFI